MNTNKRINKTKEEIMGDMKMQEKIKHIKEVVRTMYPKLEGFTSVYDAQTVVNALAGFIAADIEKKVAEIKLSELPIDLSQEEDSPIKTAILEVVELFKDESAQEFSETLERLGTTLEKFIVHKYMTEPMSTIKIDDLVSK